MVQRTKMVRMAYFDIALLANDWDFLNRVTACVATEANAPADPQGWATDHRWQIAAAPGFGDAYAYAILSGVNQPGKDASVITDGMILGAVQAELAGG